MSIEPHSHGYFEILYTIEDGFFLDLSHGITKEMTTLDVCLLPPATYHCTRQRSIQSKKLALRFHYSKAGKTDNSSSLYQIFDTVISSCKEPLFLSNEPDIFNLLNNLRQEMLFIDKATKEYTEALLNQFYILLMRKINKYVLRPSQTSDNDIISHSEKRRIWIEDYFHQYYPLSITEEHMAEKIGLSKRQLSRVLREIYRKSFREILIEERLNRASQLLLTTEQSVEEISSAVGYTSVSGFYSAFKNKFGQTAGKYRKNIKWNT